MKIAMFTNTYLPHVGGVARSVETFAEELRKLDHQVHVICPTFADEVDSTESVLRVPAIQNFNGSDFSVRLAVPGYISGHLYDFQPDIIHAHHPFLLGDAALRAARELGHPLVFTHHTLYEKYTHYVPMNSKRLQQFVIRLSTEYANFCDHIIAPSESIASLIRERGVQKPITAIPTGVDLAFFAAGDGRRLREELGIPPEAQVIGHLGRLAPEKNLDFLTRAVARSMAHDHKERQRVFLVVGSGPSEADIARLFDEAGLRDRLYLAGKRTGKDLADAYAAMDLFVFASKSETQGMVLAEAMAAGKPVIALDASGTREVVRDPETGRLLPGDADEAAFANAIDDFPMVGDAYQRCVQSVLKNVQAFSRESCGRRLADVYEDLSARARIEAQENGYSAWDSLLARLQVEWDLLMEKSSALLAAAETHDSTEEPDE